MTSSGHGALPAVGAQEVSDGLDAAWQPISVDAVLSRPPSAGSAGNPPAGGELDLNIGWERFEQLLVYVANEFLGLDQSCSVSQEIGDVCMTAGMEVGKPFVGLVRDTNPLQVLLDHQPGFLPFQPGEHFVGTPQYLEPNR